MFSIYTYIIEKIELIVRSVAMVTSSINTMLTSGNKQALIKYVVYESIQRHIVKVEQLLWHWWNTVQSIVAIVTISCCLLPCVFMMLPIIAYGYICKLYVCAKLFFFSGWKINLYNYVIGLLLNFPALYVSGHYTFNVTKLRKLTFNDCHRIYTICL